MARISKPGLDYFPLDVSSGDVLSRTGGGTVDDDGVFHCRNSFLCPLSLGNI